MREVIYVGKNQKYQTINQAINSISNPAYIVLTDKIYYEKVIIDKPNIIIDGQNKARIIYDDYATKIHADGREYNTFRTYTVLIKASHVILKNLTIENSAGEGYEVGQAVALHCYNDYITCINVSLIAHQDTLFCGPLSPDLITRYVDLLPEDERVYRGEFHQMFIDCYICGTVDFIFGGASADFINCTIESLPSRKNTWICAPNHVKTNTYGFNFYECKFISSMIEPIVFLARPWREYGMANFYHCYLGKHINEKGFDKWNDTDRHLTARFYEENSYGEGANSENRASWALKKDNK